MAILNIENIWCWLRENWKFVVTTGLFASIILAIIKAIIRIIKMIPKKLRVRKVKQFIQSMIDKHVYEFNNLPPEQKKFHEKQFDILPMQLVSELRETQEIVDEALTKLFRKKIIERDRYGDYYYQIH